MKNVKKKPGGVYSYIIKNFVCFILIAIVILIFLYVGIYLVFEKVMDDYYEEIGAHVTTDENGNEYIYFVDDPELGDDSIAVDKMNAYEAKIDEPAFEKLEHMTSVIIIVAVIIFFIFLSK